VQRKSIRATILSPFALRLVLKCDFYFIFAEKDNMTTSVVLLGSPKPSCGQLIDAEPPSAIFATPMRQEREKADRDIFERFGEAVIGSVLTGGLQPRSPELPETLWRCGPDVEGRGGLANRAATRRNSKSLILEN
jgi:hypothetical protein